jgi:hypothetical protein
VNLSDFLLQRIAEDERRADRWRTECAAVQFEEYGDTIVLDGSPWVRVLAECEAKRRIVYAAMRAQETIQRRREPVTDAVDGHVIAFRETLRLLAQPYADHPDFRPEWRA